MQNVHKNTGTIVLATLLAATLMLTGIARADALVDEGFEGANATSWNSNQLNALDPARIIPGTTVEVLSTGSVNITVLNHGANSSRSIRPGNGEVFSIPSTGVLDDIMPVATFSMTGGLNVPGTSNNTVRANETGSGMGFGWNRTTGTVSRWGGGNSNITVNVSKTNNGAFGVGDPAPLFTLAWNNNTSQNAAPARYFGDDTSGVALAGGNWFRFDGTIWFQGYDSDSNSSTFLVQAALYDIGNATDGWLDPATPVLNGTTTMTATGDFSQARPIFFNDAGRGFAVIDDLYVIPEPASMALMGLGGLLMLARRRR